MRVTPAGLIVAAVLVIGGTGGLAILLRQPAPPAKPALAPVPPQHPPEEPAEAAPPLPVIRAFTVMHDSAAYVEPDRAAPKLYDLRTGSPLCSVDITADGKWVAAMTADGQPAWIEAGDLGPFDKTALPPSTLPDKVAGTPEVMNSGMLKVDGQVVTLAGVSGLGGDYARQMTQTIVQAGNSVDCVRHGAGYTCKLPIGADVGRIALYNGVAVDSGCATADYLAQEEAARKAPRGIWR